MIPLSEPEAPPEQNHEHEAEAVLRELEEEIAREAAAEAGGTQVSDNPPPEPEVDVEAPPTLPRGWHATDTDPDDHDTTAEEPAPDDAADVPPTHEAPTVPSGWQTPSSEDESTDDTAPPSDNGTIQTTAADAPPKEEAPNVPSTEAGDEVLPTDEEPATVTDATPIAAPDTPATDDVDVPPTAEVPSGWQTAAPSTETTDASTAEQPAPASDTAASSTPSDFPPPPDVPHGWQTAAPSTDDTTTPASDNGTTETTTEEPAADPAPTSAAYAPPTDIPHGAPTVPSGWQTLPSTETETTDEEPTEERPTLPSGWVSAAPLPVEPSYDVPGEVPDEPPAPAPAPSSPLIVPPAQRGVAPLPPPPSVPTGWLMDEDTETTAPAETPAASSYLQGAYSSFPGMTADPSAPSAPPVGLPRVQMPQPPWWRKQSALVAGAAVILVVLLGVFAFIVFQEDAASLTYNGQDIEDAEGTLTSAERTTATIVEERHGASNDDTRCYFSLKDAESTDVADHLRCGPVLFVDGEADQSYLTFPLTPGDAEGDDAVLLVAADQPETPEPTQLDTGEDLRRPDDASPPSDNGGLEVPPPPRADPGVFEANPLEGVELQDPGADGEIVSYGTSYRMTGFAEPDRYGQGDAARRPASGEKFVAFQFDVGLGEFPMVADSPTLAVQIGDEAPVPLPGDPEVTLDSMILSVPEDTDVVDLVVTEQGVEQRLSLIDGTPGENNVAVLRRGTLDHITAAGADMTFSASRPGFVTETFSVNVGIPAVRLFWFFGEGGVQHPSGPNRAWLVPETTHAWGPGLGAGPDVSLDPEFFKLTLPDGTVVNASNLATDGRILVAFDVPADFTQGTLTVGGVVTRFNGETWDFGASSLSVPVNIPAG